MTTATQYAQVADPRRESGRALLLAGLQDTFSFHNISNIPDLWKRFGPWIGTLPDQVGKVTYGVCLPADEKGEFVYMAAVEVATLDDVPTDLDPLHVEPQRYLVFTHDGPLHQLSQTMNAIWRAWLPAHTEYKAVHAPTYERYGEEFSPGHPLEIWIPIE